jgi:hypothetical protein
MPVIAISVHTIRDAARTPGAAVAELGEGLVSRYDGPVYNE